MGKKKKTGKGRLDKYYKLAKEHGYRSRSAFKLIQLNKQFKFLDKVKCLVDLCAAPGGWLQVANALIPKPRLIIGIDLIPIKPINDVITIEGDIRLQDCKKKLKSELNGSKVDIILHDGSPNMGVSWGNDAFNQSDLVLSSLKFATEFLLPGGWLITKIFRSNDYNKLLWIFNKLFFKVVSTKPASSRNESAEIYVVCQGFKSPKTLDQRFLDPMYAFKEIQDSPGLSKDIEKNTNPISGISNIYHPEKRRRHRSGYSDNESILYHEISVNDFIHNSDYINILSGANCLTFGDDNQISTIPPTTDEVKRLCKDLKVLGRSDFKALIKWRRAVRIYLGLETLPVKYNDPEQRETEQDSYETINQELKGLVAKRKRKETKERERKVRAIMKQKGGYDHVTKKEIYSALSREIEDEAEDIFVNPSVEQYYDMINDNDSVNVSDNETLSASSEPEELDEEQKRLVTLEEELDDMYEEFIKRKKNYKRALLNVDNPIVDERNEKDFYESEHGGEQEEDRYRDQISPHDTPPNKNKISSKIAPFVSNYADDGSLDSSNNMHHEHNSNKEEAVYPQLNVKASDSKEGVVDEKAVLTPELIALAKELSTGAGKRRLIEKSYNRYSHGNLDSLPAWLRDDIEENHKVNIPVTREDALIARRKAEAIDARPIKKVAEAQLRRYTRVSRAVKRAEKTLEDVGDDNDPITSQKSLVAQAKKVISRSKAKQNRKVKVIVARGRYKGVAGRPKGVKGKYKLVDARMRKDKRAKNATKKKKVR